MGVNFDPSFIFHSLQANYHQDSYNPETLPPLALLTAVKNESAVTMLLCKNLLGPSCLVPAMSVMKLLPLSSKPRFPGWS